MTAPLLLAVETSAATTRVAVLAGEELVAEVADPEARPHTEVLLSSIETVLARARQPLSAIAGFAVSIGPGSFTGLRIGLATVKGLAFRSPRPVAAVPTLAALAWSARAEAETLISAIDARRGEVYAAAYGAHAGDLAQRLPEGVYSPSDLALAVAESAPTGSLVLVGGGAAICAAELLEAFPDRLRLASPADPGPRAGAVGVLGARILARNEGVSAPELVPRYLRRAEAEARRTGRALEGPEAPPPPGNPL